MDTFPDTSPPSGGSCGGKAAILALAVVLVVGLLGVGVVLLVTGGDDGGDEDEVEAAAVDEDDEGDAEPDLDGDGIPDAEDDDIDGDGVPDEEDEAPLDPDVPNPGGGADDGDDGEGDRDGDGVPDDQDADPDDPDVGDEDDADAEGDDADDGDDDGEGDSADSDDDELTPSLDLLRTDPGPAIDGWLDAAGRNAKAVEVVLYTDYGFATVRDTERPGKVRRLGWRNGTVDDGGLEAPFPGTDLDAESFKLTNVNWDALPGLVADAPQRAGLRRGEVTHVIVTSDLPFSNRKLFRIYVSAPNGSDYVVATIDGRPAER